MARNSAGVLLFRFGAAGTIEVFLVHPGGPLWARKDDGAWSIPKGEFEAGEDPQVAARREFEEETGFELAGALLPLRPLRQPSGKIVHAWAAEGDVDAGRLTSNTFSLEWPPRSGRKRDFPEIDRGEWFPLEMARRKILQGQAGFIDQLEELLRGSSPPAGPVL